jgi:hypothetical protein
VTIAGLTIVERIGDFRVTIHGLTIVDWIATTPSRARYQQAPQSAVGNPSIANR